MSRIDDALAQVPRTGFLLRSQRRRASYDGPIRIGHGQTNSQPRTVGDMLRLLDPRPGQRVLDVGAGSGWTTALLARLVGPEGEVLGLELVPELARWGAANLAATGQPWASLAVAVPGVLGDPVGAPWDRILVSAEAGRLPADLVAQLAPEGRLVIPVAGRMALVVKDSDGLAATSWHGHYRFVPLIGGSAQRPV